jgi:hypothetical protein
VVEDRAGIMAEHAGSFRSVAGVAGGKAEDQGTAQNQRGQARIKSATRIKERTRLGQCLKRPPSGGRLFRGAPRGKVWETGDRCRATEPDNSLIPNASNKGF